MQEIYHGERELSVATTPSRRGRRRDGRGRRRGRVGRDRASERCRARLELRRERSGFRHSDDILHRHLHDDRTPPDAAGCLVLIADLGLAVEAFAELASGTDTLLTTDPVADPLSCYLVLTLYLSCDLLSALGALSS